MRRRRIRLFDTNRGRTGLENGSGEREEDD